MNACGLQRYVTAATVVRCADASAAVGLVLLAVDTGAGARAGAAPAVALTAPHLLGPWVAHRLDRARDGRAVLAGAFVVYSAAIAVAALLLGRAPLAAAVGATLLAGTAGPLLTGGMSSLVAGLARDGERAQRRAEGWDAVTYGIAGAGGPAAVAAVATLTTPLAAVLTLAAAALAAAPLTLTLPACHRAAPGDALAVRDTLEAMAARGPLRRATVSVLVTALAFGAVLSVVAVMLGAALTDRAGAGAALVAAYGLGNLAGSLLVTAFPLTSEPDVTMPRLVALLGGGLVLCALAPTYPLALAGFALCGAVNAPFMAATLAARSLYAPPGGRAQVFVSQAGAKIAMASAGTALAGVAASAGPRALIGVAAAVTLAGAGAAALDRRLTAA